VIKPERRFPETVAVLRALQLGDLLCAVPCFRALRRAWPAARITLVGLPWAKTFVARFTHYLDGFQEFPGFDGIPERGFDASRMQAFMARASAFDIAIQLHGNGSVTNRFLPSLRPTLTAGFFPAGQACPDPDRFIVYPEDEHEVRRLLKLVRHLGLPSSGEDLEFPLTHADYHEANQAMAEGGLRPGHFACVHVGARDAKRRWALGNFLQVADGLAARGMRIVLTGTSDEAEQTAVLREQLGASCLDLAGKTSLGGLAALLKTARLLISNDTGISHIAAALQVPSVVVFSASDPRRWAPLDTSRHRSLGDPFASSAVHATPTDVLREAFGLLDESPLRLEARDGGFPTLPSVEWSRVRRILLVHPGSEADVVLLAPCLAALRSSGRTLGLLTSSAGAALASLLPGVDHLLVAEHGCLVEPIQESAVRKVVDQLRAASFEAAVILTRLGQSPYAAAYNCYLAGIPIRVAASKEFGGALLTHWIRKLPDALDPEARYLALLAAVELPSHPAQPALAVPPGEEGRIKGLLREQGFDPDDGIVLLDDTASPVDGFLDQVSSLTGMQVVRHGSQSVSAVDTAALVQLSDLVITCEPVTSRMADAFRRPLIAMGAAATPSDGWRPRRSVSKLLVDGEAGEEHLLQAVRTLLWLPGSAGETPALSGLLTPAFI